MITTTAEAPRSSVSAAFRLAPLALAALLLSNECRADWKFTPLFDLRETYTDNATQQREELARNEWITEAAPGFALTGNTPRLTLSATARWRRFAYSDKAADPNLRDGERNYEANGRAMVVDQLFYVDAGANGRRQSVSAFGQLSDSPYVNANRTDVSTWRISPYLQHRFGSTATGEVRFTRDSVDSGFNGFGSSVGSTASASLASGPAFRDLGWNLSYNHQDLSNERAGKSTSENAVAGLRYRLIPRLMLTASAGYDDYRYATLGERTSGPSWSVGFAWTPSLRSTVEASVGHRYFGKTGSLAASHRTRHSVWSLDYSDQVITTRSQFLLPAAIDTASMLDRLFSASFPDPVQRQQAIQAYMAATGLPPTLADSINYLSNRYIRAKQLRGAAIFRGARSSLTFSLFYDKRNALSLQQSDSTLLGSQLGALNDNVRQRGGNIDADYRLTARTTLQASGYLVRAQSIDTGIANNNRQWRLGLSHTLSAKTQGNIELRHVRGNYGFDNDSVFHENAIAATLSVVY